MIVHIGNDVPAERFYHPRKAVVSVVPVRARKQIEHGQTRARRVVNVTGANIISRRGHGVNARLSDPRWLDKKRADDKAEVKGW